jgi:lipopolysaccharide core biosynthesis protein rfaY
MSKNKIPEKIIKVLKDDHRSYVYVFELEPYGDKKFVYKESREKNKRKWQRFLNFFRGSESKREYYQMEKINSLGLKTAKPVFYNKEYLMYEYIEGNEPTIDDIDLVVKELKKIHSMGYLHGDSHINNFLISPEKEVYIIDSKFQKNKYGKFGEIFEMMYLEDSVGIEIDYDKKSFY